MGSQDCTVYSVHPHPLSARDLSLLPNFQKRDAWRSYNFYIRNNVKSEIFNDKKGLQSKIFFSFITKNINWEILSKNLVSFKRWNGVKNEKF